MDSNIDLGAFKFRKRPSLTFKSNGGEGERLKLTNVTNHVGTDSRSGENNACATNAPFRNRNIGRNVEILDSTTRNDDGSCSERNLETLCEMFPNKEKHQLREILKLTNSLDEATCVLLDDEGQVGGWLWFVVGLELMTALPFPYETHWRSKCRVGSNGEQWSILHHCLADSEHYATKLQIIISLFIFQGILELLETPNANFISGIVKCMEQSLQYFSQSPGQILLSKNYFRDGW